MRTLLVTSTAESTGKTAVALGLATLARDRGLSAGYLKPKGTRLESNVGKTLDGDPLVAREVLALDSEVHDLEPVVYSPTFVREVLRGREDPDALREAVRERFDAVADGRDLVLVEGGADLATGAAAGLTDVAVADLLDAEVLLVAPYEEPGDVDSVLAAAEQLGDRLAGVVFNAVADGAMDELEADARPFLESKGVPVVGVVPRVRELAGVRVADLAAELGAEVLTDAPTDGYVERFVVGAMGAERALAYFRRARDAAVVTGGDRPEIQSVALEASGVRCLVLTGGHRPPGAVLGRAEDQGVPVLVVQSDTLSTVERAEALLAGGRTRDADAVERMGRLLAERVDVDGLLGGDDGGDAAIDDE